MSGMPFIMGSVIICYVRKQEFPAGGSSWLWEPNYAPDPGDWYVPAANALWSRSSSGLYLGSAFDVSLPRCPSCGLTMIPKSLAEGKMAEVEALLEDK